MTLGPFSQPPRQEPSLTSSSTSLAETFYQIRSAILTKGEDCHAQARRIVINKYHLSSKWQPTEGLGLTGASFRRSHVDVLSSPDIDPSMQALSDCLHSDAGTPFFKGCYPADLRSH